MKYALFALAVLAPGMPVSAAKAVRDAAARVQLDLFLDAPVRDAVGGSPAPLASHLSENPLELGDLAPGLDLADDSVRRALLSGQSADYLRELRRTGQQAPADDDIAQGLVEEALEREEADRRWLRRARKPVTINLTTFRNRVEGVLRTISMENPFDGTDIKRRILSDSDVHFLRGPKDKASGRPARIPIADATPFQIGQVFRSYYRSLRNHDNGR